MIKAVLCGALGKMGTVIGKAIALSNDIQLVSAVDPKGAGIEYGKVIGVENLNIPVREKIEDVSEEFDLIVDFTNAESAYRNVLYVLNLGKKAVIGTTGLSKDMIEDIKRKTEEKKSAVLIAPNFALGAVLMIKMAKELVKYFPDVEIVELHHNEKIDAPSGTALLTAEILAEELKKRNLSHFDATKIEKIPNVRGGKVDSVNIHSVRLPGLVAHQEIIFGGVGQILTIRHDAISRDCYIPGVLLGIREVYKRTGFFYGLETILEEGE
ncbi:MAG: 4-hydroxy-tetrahydrodipicolinate reductase [Dictyoglomus sp. NZ13-RE01]|nr:MAG: 4-hydroxy-tetrahydrodipicolinate reductase [Dictyoglomus sp. NZ13-RE01]